MTQIKGAVFAVIAMLFALAAFIVLGILLEVAKPFVPENFDSRQPNNHVMAASGSPDSTRRAFLAPLS
jgi:hypothetical protein